MLVLLELSIFDLTCAQLACFLTHWLGAWLWPIKAIIIFPLVFI